MSQPFVKIINDKLSLVGSIPTGNPRVISILGKARMGKSTFLNAIVSHLRKESQSPFKAMDCDDHCTRGIDAYYMEEHNLLLLDSQGLDYEDASHDPHLLLLLYILSDVIIFNDTRRLENGALKLMESVCTFTNYLDIDTVVKPKLCFRIFDSDVKDPQKNLEKVLGSYPDQYQSIRNSIKHLFHKDLSLLKTEPLDRPAKLMLANNMYRELLNEPLGFKDAIESILHASRTAEKKAVLLDVPNIISMINNNQEISIEKLDVVKLQAENDIHKWIQDSISSTLYSELVVDGTQLCFEEVVEPRKNSKKATLTAFTKRFKDVEESIRGPFYKSIQEKMDAPIQKAIEESRLKAQEIIKVQLANARALRDYPQVNSLNNSFTTIPADYWHTYLGVFNTLELVINHVYEPVRKETADWIEQARAVVRTTVSDICKEEVHQRLAASKLSAEMIVGMEVWMWKFIQNTVSDKTVLQTNNELMEQVKNAYIEEFVQQLINLVPRHKLYFKMSEGGRLAPIKEIVVDTNVQSYDLTSTIYNFFLEKVDFYTNNPSTSARKSIVEQKEKFLYGKVFALRGSATVSMIKNNPEITFVEDTNLFGPYLTSHHFNVIVTLQTYKETYEKLYTRVFVSLIEKGYCTKEYVAGWNLKEKGEEKNILQMGYAMKNVQFHKNLFDIFVRRLQKEFCKMTVEGFVFPEEVSE